jgi:hypothetical protein
MLKGGERNWSEKEGEGLGKEPETLYPYEYGGT